MERCENIELLRVEGKYISFIAELRTEKKILKHIMRCENCRNWVISSIDGDEIHKYFGKLFDTIVYDPTVPKYSDYEDINSFIDARITWRLERLDELIKNAEMELDEISKKLIK
ncbi:MAG: hypothetical protein GF329_12210 [Candidatus Lokiarchaeota archaeon]|nr:hypothetical protein [Candidatus Lokiarchaeota archaeon]